MGDAPKRLKVATVVWSLLLTVGVIILAGSILLPSTKRARFNFTEEESERRAAAPAAERESAETNAAPVPATQP